MPSFGYPPRGNKGVATKASKVRGVRTEVTLPAPAENFQSRCLLHVICMRHAARFSFPPAREARDYAITRRDSVSASRRRRSRHASVMRDSQSGLFLRLFRFITSVSTERRLAGPTAFFLLCSSLRGLLFLRRHWRLSSPFAALAVRIPSAFLNADQVPWHAIPRPGSGRVSLSLARASMDARRLVSCFGFLAPLGSPLAEGRRERRRFVPSTLPYRCLPSFLMMVISQKIYSFRDSSPYHVQMR